ncbi:MAG: hypothetical protein ABF636_02100 [Acetobacter sp.]
MALPEEFEQRKGSQTQSERLSVSPRTPGLSLLFFTCWHTMALLARKRNIQDEEFVLNMLHAWAAYWLGLGFAPCFVG